MYQYIGRAGTGKQVIKSLPQRTSTIALSTVLLASIETKQANGRPNLLPDRRLTDDRRMTHDDTSPRWRHVFFSSLTHLQSLFDWDSMSHVSHHNVLFYFIVGSYPQLSVVRPFFHYLLSSTKRSFSDMKCFQVKSIQQTINAGIRSVKVIPIGFERILSQRPSK